MTVMRRPRNHEITLDELLSFAVPVPHCGCFIWDRRWESGNGYGKIRYKGKEWMAHRLAFFLHKGYCPPREVLLDHLCRVRCCIAPWHLDPVDTAINTHRGEAVLFGDVEFI